MATTGRPPKRQETKTFTVAVPMNLYEYLDYLARHSFIGSDVGEVASYILINQGRLFVETKFHDLKAPKDAPSVLPEPEKED